MAYLGDRKRFADKVYSVFPSVEKVGDRLMGMFTCQICGELDSYEYDELLQELRGQASDGWAESLSSMRSILPKETSMSVSMIPVVHGNLFPRKNTLTKKQKIWR